MWVTELLQNLVDTHKTYSAPQAIANPKKNVSCNRDKNVDELVQLLLLNGECTLSPTSLLNLLMIKVMIKLLM